MSTAARQQDQSQQPEQKIFKRDFDPGHVMTREHYERLAREAASQK